jgi:predicted Abi (CAAX) family protease
MVAIVVPCFGEELFFRVLLIPRQTENVSTLKRWIFVIVALALFVAWHPLNGWLLKVSARSIFFDPTFLLLAAILGATCTTAYYRTASVWPAVMIHWLTLMVWKIVFGGKLIAIAS